MQILEKLYNQLSETNKTLYFALSIKNTDNIPLYTINMFDYNQPIVSGLTLNTKKIASSSISWEDAAEKLYNGIIKEIESFILKQEVEMKTKLDTLFIIKNKLESETKNEEIQNRG